MSDATPFGDEDLRKFAEDELARHTPANQENNGYDRCAECHFTRHPCDVYDLAAAVLRLLDEKRPLLSHDTETGLTTVVVQHDASFNEPVIETEMTDDRLAKLPWVKFDTPGPGQPGDASDAT